MAMKRHLLFVYGTLRRGHELHHHLQRLGARFVGTARVAAVLHKRRRYPGARPTGQRGQWVPGELFALRCPVRDLRVLDVVEGCVSGGLQNCEFVRGTAEAVLENAARRRAWIYWLGTGPLTKGIAW
jgi:gamma-glutamylcyclotransferase (GGCT)/AIG2-like uncharacterized protein YtfP